MNVRVEFIKGRVCYSLFVTVTPEEQRQSNIYAAARVRAQEAIGNEARIIGIYPPDSRYPGWACG